MATEVKLPKLGQTMEEGTIVNCLVREGDEVKKGSIIFEIETDKATLEMESPAAGFVKRILAQPGQTLPVGEPVMILGDRDEVIKEVPSAAASAPAEGTESISAQAVSRPAAVPERIAASPRAKKLAGELGVDLSAIKGTGPGGRITEEDVKAFGSAAAAKPAAADAAGAITLGSTVPLNRLQRITAQKMLQSKQQIPCFYLSVRVDVTSLVKFRNKLNEGGSQKVSYNDFIMKAVATGLEKFPIMTGQLDGSSIKLAESIGIGLAISVPDGLVAPIVKDVNKKDVRRIAADSSSLIDRARANKLSAEDIEGGCITVSNLGAFGIESFIPIVVPGQCSILGIGQISDCCVPGNGGFTIRKLMTMTLSVDHKVANGAYAAQFLDFVRKTLEDTSNFK